MTGPDFENDSNIDLASADLDYEAFRKLARNPNLSANERIGFPDSYRSGYYDAIFDDILLKLPRIGRGHATVVDVGPGCAHLPVRLIRYCEERGNRLVLVDSEEMLSQLPESTCVAKVPGLFPRNFSAVRETVGQADAILCYSVLHYLYVDSNLFDVIDCFVELLAPGGAALVGDIPNVSKRRRFFSSEAGIRFHQAFTGRDEIPDVVFNGAERGKIDDAVLAALVARAQAAGCDAYVLPQPDTLPMANRRDDLLIRRP